MNPIFSRNEDHHKIAFLNWRIESDDNILNMLNLAEGYMKSAQLLTEICLQDNRDKKGDIVIFPIFANFNHAIELYLKAINWTLNKLTGDTRKIEGGHNLKLLYYTIRKKIATYGGNIKVHDFDTSMEQLKSYLEELFNRVEATDKDPKMDFARYPITSSYEDHFYVGLMGSVEVDLEKFWRVIVDVHKSFLEISNFLFWKELNNDW